MQGPVIGIQHLEQDESKLRRAHLVLAWLVNYYVHSSPEDADPNAAAIAPPAPWHGIMQPLPVRRRYDIVHFVEEFARHAGHADIIREQLDGMAIPVLVMSIEGMPASQFFQPYVPAPGTIGAV